MRWKQTVLGATLVMGLAGCGTSERHGTASQAAGARGDAGGTTTDGTPGTGGVTTGGRAGTSGHAGSVTANVGGAGGAGGHAAQGGASGHGGRNDAGNGGGAGDGTASGEGGMAGEAALGGTGGAASGSGGSAGAPLSVPTVTSVVIYGSSVACASCDFDDVPIGDPGPTRTVIVTVFAVNDNAVSVDSLSVSGIEFTKLGSVGEGSAPSAAIALYAGNVPDGSTASVHIDFSAMMTDVNFQTHAAYALASSTAADIQTLESIRSEGVMVDVPPGGTILAALTTLGGDNVDFTWDSPLEREFQSNPTVFQNGYASGAAVHALTSGGPQTVGATVTGSSYTLRLLAASFH
jgi:hypothetical protein